MEKNCAVCNRAILPGNVYYKWADKYICSTCGGSKTMSRINDALGGFLAMIDTAIESSLVNQTDSEQSDYKYTPADIKNARAIINAIKALGYNSDSEFSQAVASADIDNAENAGMLKSLHAQLYSVMAHPHYEGNLTLNAMWHQWIADDSLWDAERGIDYSLPRNEFAAVYGDDIEALRHYMEMCTDYPEYTDDIVRNYFGLVDQTEQSLDTAELKVYSAAEQAEFTMAYTDNEGVTHYKSDNDDATFFFDNEGHIMFDDMHGEPCCYDETGKAYHYM